MGIHNLNSLLRKKCPQVFKEVHLSNLAYTKVAIDISLFMFKYKTIHGDKWLSGFLTLYECLRKNLIHPILAFCLSEFILNLNELLVIIVTMAAALPSGSQSYYFAYRYDSLKGIVSSNVVLSTFVSFFVLSLLLLFFNLT